VKNGQCAVCCVRHWTVESRTLLSWIGMELPFAAASSYGLLRRQWQSLLMPLQECLFLQPLALQYSKRPVYLTSILATAGIMAWAAHTNTDGKWIANKLLQGCVGVPIESLCEVSVTDSYFTHERGQYLALCGCSSLDRISLRPSSRALLLMVKAGDGCCTGGPSSV